MAGNNHQDELEEQCLQSYREQEIVGAFLLLTTNLDVQVVVFSLSFSILGYNLTDSILAFFVWRRCGGSSKTEHRYKCPN